LVTTSAPTPKLQLVEGSSTWVGCALSAECSIGSTRKKFALNPEEKEAGQPSSKLYLASNLATGHTSGITVVRLTINHVRPHYRSLSMNKFTKTYVYTT